MGGGRERRLTSEGKAPVGVGLLLIELVVEEVVVVVLEVMVAMAEVVGLSSSIEPWTVDSFLCISCRRFCISGA